MNVRALSPSELAEFDNSLTLFKDSEWDFSRVFVKQVNNYAYFDAVADISEASRLGGLWAILKSTVPFAALLASCGIFAYNQLVLPSDYKDYLNTLNTIQTDEVALKVDYASGVEASDDELIAASKLLSEYFKADIYDLNSYCLNGSAIVTEYKNCIEQMQAIHDINDMHSRFIASCLNDYDLIQIDKLIIDENGRYMCYCIVDRPTGKSIEDYALTNAYNYTKKFQGTTLSDAAIIEYTIDLKETEPMITERGIECIVLAKDSLGNFAVADDSEMLNTISDAYTSLLQQLNKIIQKEYE